MSYTYKITVFGTEIEQYYRLPFKATEEQVEGIFLLHVSEENELGRRLAEQWSDNVEVKALWKTHSEQPADRKVVEVTQAEAKALLGNGEVP